MDELKKLYYNPKTGLGGVDALIRKAKYLGLPIDRNIIKEFIERQPSYQITKAAKVMKKNYNKIVVPYKMFQWQIDLAYVDKYDKQNNNIKYLLVVIDTFSRYLWIVPMKERTNLATKKALETIVDKVGFPENINFDEGVEFQGTCDNYLKDNDVKIWTATPDTHTRKNGIVERVIGTIRRKILNYMTSHDTLKYIDVLPDIVENYNNSFHRGIFCTPKQAWDNSTNVKGGYISKGENKAFSIGDMVRIKTIKKTFEKEIPDWSEGIYNILESKGMGYIVADIAKNKVRDGRRIRTFMPYELQKVNEQDDKPIIRIIDKIKKVKKEKKQRILLKSEAILNENIVETKRIKKKVIKLDL